MPSGIHSCRSHVCGACHGWVTDKDRKPEVKVLGKRFISMFAHIADRMTSMKSIRDAMTLLAYIIVLLRRDEIYLPAFDVNSTVRYHHDDLEWSRHATEMKVIFDQAALTPCISTFEEMKDLVDVEMKDNGCYWKQSFSGVQQASDITTLFSTRKPFVYAYLVSVDHKKSTGVVKYHLLYDAVENEDGKLTPVTSGFFEENINLPFLGGFIGNPWKCLSAANYFANTWLKESALWSPALVVLLKKVLKKHIYDNDQHMEGVIKNVKQQPDRLLDCDEPALYFYSRWKDLKASNRTFVADLEKMSGVVAKRKENAEADQVAKATKRNETEDAKKNKAFMLEDAVWDTGARGSKAELELRNKLEVVFLKSYGKKNYKVWHKVMKDYIVETGVGTITGMGYDVFGAWMGNRRVSKKDIGAGAMRGMEHFLTNWKKGD